MGRGRRWDVWLGHAGMCGSPTWQRLGQHPSVRRAFEVPEAAGWAPWHMAIFCTFRGLAPRLAALGAPPDIRRVFCGDWGGALLRFGRAEAGESGGSLSDIIISLKGCPGFTCFFAPTSQQDPRGGEGARISQPFFLPPPPLRRVCRQGQRTREGVDHLLIFLITDPKMCLGDFLVCIVCPGRAPRRERAPGGCVVGSRRHVRQPHMAAPGAASERAAGFRSAGSRGLGTLAHGHFLHFSRACAPFGGAGCPS